jgi:hypothetical protein
VFAGIVYIPSTRLVIVQPSRRFVHVLH